MIWRALLLLALVAAARYVPLNRAGHLPSEDVSRERLRLDPPLLPNQPPTVEFIAHHCHRKTNMASLQKQVVHNEPLLCPVPGCGRWESKYNMPAHLQMDHTHKEYPFTPEQKAKREVPEEEKAVLQIGLTAWQKQLSTQKSAKEKKRLQQKRRKLKGEVTLQREILAKAEKKAAKKAGKKAARRAAKAGD